MTFDYTIIPVRHDAVGSTDKIQGFARKRKAVSRRFKKDRRKQ